MCWNQEVSLNTFLFSSLVLALVAYNNAFTQYKIKDFNSIWWYLFFASVFSMQLVEFFLWRNVSNPMWNAFFSKAAFILLFIQPICSLMILSNEKLRNILLFIYLFFGIPFSIYKLITYKFKTLVSPCGHLNWNFNYYYALVSVVWTFFLLFSLFYEGKVLYAFFGLLTLIILLYKYYNDKTQNSMWCWVINSISLYLAFYLLFYLPFYEKIRKK